MPLLLACLLAACGGGGNPAPAETPAPSTPSTPTTPTTPANQAPSGLAASLAVAEDASPSAAAVAVADADAGDTHTLSVLTAPGRGLATLANGELTYTPDPGFSGTDSVALRAADAAGATVDGSAAITVAAVNDAPAATGGGRAVHAGQAARRAPWVDDADVGDAHALTLLSAPAHGNVALAGGEWVYTHDGAFTSGTDSFTFAMTDSAGASATGTARVRVYDDAALATCLRTSTVNPDGSLAQRTRAEPCAYYASHASRQDAGGANVTHDYVVARPSGGAAPKAVVIVIGGGDLDMQITGDAGTGEATFAAGNFVVRTLQMLADRGYSAVAVDRPSDVPTAGAADALLSVDQYRVSVRHAVDLVRVLDKVNPLHLPVFLVGTSRGAMSVVAQSPLASGISVSSPVTSDPTRLYVGHPGTANLQAGFVARPAHVMWHAADGCGLSTPAGAQALAAAINASADTLTGGVVVTKANASGSVTPDVCGAFHHHGFLGIEPAAVGRVADWLDARVAALGSDAMPRAWPARVRALPGTPRRIDLSTVARDADGDALGFGVTQATTERGGTVSVAGAIATYTPPAGLSNATDRFVFTVSDGRGGVGAALVTVLVGS